jgi:hypothetical protein
MLGRLFLAIAVCGSAAVAPARATDIYAQLFPLTGEIRLLNKSDTSIPFVFYSIESAPGALNSSSAVWESITENYDRPIGPTPGNGLVDPNGDWLKLIKPTQLAEGALDEDGGMLPAFRAISLGHIWNPLVDFDLVFDVRSQQEIIPVVVEFALEGDYSNDYTVDQADYLVWRKYLNSLTAYFADGDLDGIVDLDDRLVWEENFGVTLTLPLLADGRGRLSGATGAVPEPSSAALLLLVAGTTPLLARRRARPH